MEYWREGGAGGESPLVQTYSGRAGLLDRYLPPVFRPSFLANVIVFFWAGKPETREPLFQVPDSCVLLLLFLQKLKNDFGKFAADAIHLLDLRHRRFPETFH